MAALREQISRVLARQADAARRSPPILVLGETGTGKGLVAGTIHRAGARARGPFVDVNCAAIPETLLEAELFGWERGAFTDARQAKPGLFQAAHGGTIFLDEVGLLPWALQSKLLKVIEEQQVRRLGSTRSEAVDVWVIAATSEDLDEAIRARRFREDLYHRLAVLTLRLPPLRERGDDIVHARRALPRARVRGLRAGAQDPDAGGVRCAPDVRLARQRAPAGQRDGAGGAVHGRARGGGGRARAQARLVAAGAGQPGTRRGARGRHERGRAGAPAGRARGERREHHPGGGAAGASSQHAPVSAGPARAGARGRLAPAARRSSARYSASAGERRDNGRRPPSRSWSLDASPCFAPSSSRLAPSRSRPRRLARWPASWTRREASAAGSRA